MNDSYDKPHMILYVLDQADLPGPSPFTAEDHNSVDLAIKSVAGGSIVNCHRTSLRVWEGPKCPPERGFWFL